MIVHFLQLKIVIQAIIFAIYISAPARYNEKESTDSSTIPHAFQQKTQEAPMQDQHLILYNVQEETPL